MTASQYRDAHLNTGSGTALPSATRCSVGDAYSHLQRLLGVGEPIASAMNEIKRTQRHVSAGEGGLDPSFPSAASDFYAITGP